MSRLKADFLAKASLVYDELDRGLSTSIGKDIATHCRPGDDETQPVIVALCGIVQMLKSLEHCGSAVRAAFIGVLAQLLLNDVKAAEHESAKDFNEAIKLLAADVGVTLGVQVLCLSEAGQAAKLERFEQIGDVLAEILSGGRGPRRGPVAGTQDDLHGG